MGTRRENGLASPCGTGNFTPVPKRPACVSHPSNSNDRPRLRERRRAQPVADRGQNACTRRKRSEQMLEGWLHPSAANWCEQKRGGGGHMPGTTTTVDTSDNLFVLGETLRPLTHQV